MKVDYIIVGGGIAGASAAYFLSKYGSVALLERESSLGYHSSGRTNAQFTVGISAPTMRRLAEASRSFFVNPPENFCEHAIATPRGCLTVGKNFQKSDLLELRDDLNSVGATAVLLDGPEALSLFPALRPENVDFGVLEPDAMDIDVDLLLQGYMRGAKANGASIIQNAPVERIRKIHRLWHISVPNGEFTAPIVINAAGAWVDDVTRLAGYAPLGVVPHRRTAFTFGFQTGLDSGGWPHVSNVDYKWYVKPGKSCFTGSLADAVPVEPSDVYPDDIDVAQAIENIEQDTILHIGRPLSQWAGLRTFVADKNPVAGTREDADGFFWLAGQGGCGILTSPAMGQAIAAIVTQTALPEKLQKLEVSASDLSAGRSTLRSK